MKISARVKALILLAVSIYLLARGARMIIAMSRAPTTRLGHHGSHSLSPRRTLKSCNRC